MTGPTAPTSTARALLPTPLAAAPGAAVVVVTVVAGFALGSRLWFFSDDWNIIAGWPSGRLLEPFNSHLSLVPVGVYQTLFHTFGLESYTPYRVAGLAAYGLLGVTMLRFTLERLGRSATGAAAAALATAAVLWNEGGSTNVMFPFLMNFSIPIAALLAVWWHLDHETPRHDATASVWIAVALATSGLGLLVVAAVGVELLWSAAQERRIDVRRWAILAPGPAMWVVWYAVHGVDSPASGGLRPVVSYAARMLLAGASSLVVGNRALGVLLGLGLAALAVRAVAHRTFDGRLAGAVTAPVAFALLTAVSRIGVVPAIPPDELRYRWTIGAFLVVVLVLLVRANRGADGSAVAWRSAAPLVVATAAVLVGGVRLLDGIDEWNAGVETAVPGVRANLREAEAAANAGVLDRDRPLPVSYVRVTAGEYVDAVVELGSPLDATDGSVEGTADSLAAADRALADDFGVALTTDDVASCASVPEEDPLPNVLTPGQTARIAASTTPVGVRVAVFSLDPTTVVGTVAPGTVAYLTGPDLGTADLGAFRVDAPGGTLTLCP